MNCHFNARPTIVGLLAACLIPLSTAAWAGGPGPSGLNFGPAEPVTAVNDPAAADGCPIEAPDGLSLVIASRRDGGDNDIWSAERDSIQSPWHDPEILPEPINSAEDDFCPTPVADRLLFFVSNRPAACTGGNMYLSRQGLAGIWSQPALLPCAPDGPNFNADVFSPSLVESRQGTFLFYSSPGDQGDHDIYVSKLGSNGQFGPGQIVRALSNLVDDDRMPNVRAMDNGGFEVVFSSTRATWGRHNLPSFGGHDVYRSVTYSLPFRWTAPVNLGPNVNNGGSETRSTLSRDGHRLYFGRNGDIFVSERP